MKLIDGYLLLFRWRGRFPVRLHWAALIPLALAAVSPRVSVLAALGWPVVVFVHELGHAQLVRRCGLRVREVRVFLYGGECIYDAAAHERDDVLIAWGGVLAQLALLVATYVVLALLPGEGVLFEFLQTLVPINVSIMLFNLLPFRPLDGHKAWRLKKLFVNWPRAPRAPRRSSPPRGKASRVVDQAAVDALIDNALRDAQGAIHRTRRSDD